MTHAHADPSKDVTFGTARRGDAGRGWRDSAHVAPGSSRRRVPRPRPCVRRRRSGMRERAPDSPAKWGCAGPCWGAPVPAGMHINPAKSWAAGSGAGEGPRSPPSRFRAGSTRWTRMSNHRAPAVPARGHTGTSVSAARSEGHSVLSASSSSRRSPRSAPPGGTARSPSALPRRQGTRGPPAALLPGGAARGAGPGAELGQSRAGDGTSGPSLCPLSAGSVRPSGALGGAACISSQKLLWTEVVFLTNDNYCNYLIARWHPEATDN